MDINLKGRLAVVTGGSGQLGRVICRTLANCGADWSFIIIATRRWPSRCAAR